MNTLTERAIRLRILKLRWNAIRAARRAYEILEAQPFEALERVELCSFVTTNDGDEWDRRPR